MYVVAYMSSEEYLSETAVSEWHEGNSSGSDEDLPNRENLCVCLLYTSDAADE